MSGKTKKERTLKAWRELIKRYKNPISERDLQWDTEDCPLCKIHYRPHSFYKHILHCHGCPFGRYKDAFGGCGEFFLYGIHRKKDFKEITDLLESWLPEIEKHPAKHFTRSGWEYFGLKEPESNNPGHSTPSADKLERIHLIEEPEGKVGGQK